MRRDGLGPGRKTALLQMCCAEVLLRTELKDNGGANDSTLDEEPALLRPTSAGKLGDHRGIVALLGTTYACVCSCGAG